MGFIDILYHLKKRGFEVTGCDPSAGAEIGKEFGIDIKRKFFNPDDFMRQNIFFDIVISRHFIEHVIDPKELISNFKTNF